MASVIYEGKWSKLLWTGRHAAPQSVDQAFELAAKAAGGEVLGVVAQCTISEGHTAWRVVAAAGRRLVVLDADAPVDDWTRDNDGYRNGSQSYLNLDGQSIKVRLLPISSIAAIEVADPIGRVISRTNSERRLTGQWTIVLADERLVLPPAEPHSLDGADPTADLVQALTPMVS
ncbi:hypothetical protein ATK17_1623 [Branchiibius hedensis]|uniref:Uncharacterized protein n=1 Tax=Branchiibius hedensis TaxID=672460 RepID=A0A2Y8ZVM8_9MICO|nr:hypothetical protein [Branchiibius hedensis]PWJ25496.1 hypothetical protein ATK17_1623 [Branchiibius hedensis]SSA34309.1 hypothetical protein SAMN04489750_1623 [Branchiibius hedensis]